MLSLFAGLWSVPVKDREQIHALRRLLPVFGQGLLHEAESLKAASVRHITLKEKIQLFISENFNRAISTRDLAKHLSLSLSRTSHLVRESCGRSFSFLLIQERIYHAKLFLYHTDYRMNEIAFMCGFVNVEHFCRMFKNITGMSPGKFRQAQTKPVKSAI